MSEQNEQFDSLLLSMVEQQPQGALQLIDAFASFLGRKTDFFVDNDNGAWKKILLSSFCKHAKISREKHQTEREEKKRKRREEKERKRKKKRERDVEHRTGQDVEARDLNNDALLNIFEYLEVQDLLSASRVCRQWHDAALHPSVWKSVHIKSEHVVDWHGLADALQRQGTQTFFMQGQREGFGGREDPHFSDAMARVSTFVSFHLHDFWCPSDFLEKLADRNPDLQLLITMCDSENKVLDLNALSGLAKLTTLSLETNRLASDLGPLLSLTSLRDLSLTAVEDLYRLDIEVVGSMTGLEALELGDCTNFPDQFGTQVVSKLTSLRKLSLERLDNTYLAQDVLDVVSKMPSVSKLGLIDWKFDFEGFDKSLAACVNIKELYLTSYSDDWAMSNQLMLSGVLQLKETLTYLNCDFEMESHTQTVPVLRPVPVIDCMFKRDSPEAIVSFAVLEDWFKNCLPNTTVVCSKSV